MYPPAADDTTTPVSKTILQAQPLDDTKNAVGDAFACVLSGSDVESQFAHDCSVDERVKILLQTARALQDPDPTGQLQPQLGACF